MGQGFLVLFFRERQPQVSQGPQPHGLQGRSSNRQMCHLQVLLFFTYFSFHMFISYPFSVIFD